MKDGCPQLQDPKVQDCKFVYPLFRTLSHPLAAKFFPPDYPIAPNYVPEGEAKDAVDQNLVHPMASTSQR